MARMQSRGKITPKIRVNVNPILDLITGDYIIGKYGESILNGGLPQLITYSGPTNNYKSFVSDHWSLTATDRIAASYPTCYNKNDTEMNFDIDQADTMGYRYPNLDDKLVTGPNEHWMISDASLTPGDHWKHDFIAFVEETTKEKKVVYEGHLDRYTNEPLKMHVPSFYSLDTMTEMRTSTSKSKNTEYKTDDGSDNTDPMNMGRFKAALIAILPELLNRSNCSLSMVAQVGETIDMGGKWSPKPMKKLQYMKDVDVLKGVPRNYLSLPHVGLLFHNAKGLLDSSKKKVLYPSRKKEYMATDLNIVIVTVLRNKLGHDGLSFMIIVSKEDGIMESLSSFHTIFIKEFGNRYGISGNRDQYSLDLRPSVTLSRTILRDIFADDKRTAKALEFTVSMFELSMLSPNLLMDDTLCTPKQLHDDLIELGYDWDILLDTVSWYTPTHYTDDRRFLTVMCLLRMRKGLYHPYWLDDDKKTILPMKKYRNKEVKNESKRK